MALITPGLVLPFILHTGIHEDLKVLNVLIFMNVLAVSCQAKVLGLHLSFSLCCLFPSVHTSFKLSFSCNLTILGLCALPFLRILSSHLAQGHTCRVLLYNCFL